MNINEKKSFDVIVIGGGAAGMMAAITAASNGADTMILEHKDRVGKKILSTGNGKCNYTNELQGVTYYRGDDPAFVLPVMEQFGFEETVSFSSVSAPGSLNCLRDSMAAVASLASSAASMAFFAAASTA